MAGGMRIAVCVPHYGPLNARFVASLTQMIAATAGRDVNFNGELVRPRIIPLFAESGPLDYKRTLLVKRAREQGAHYIQWIDNDQTFPADASLKLARHDLPIVGCNYVQRNGPPQPTAMGLDGAWVATVEAKGDAVERVASVGFGFCLMKAQVFDQIAQPWFTTELGPDGEVVRSDDLHFGCRRRKRACRSSSITDSPATLGMSRRWSATIRKWKAPAEPGRRRRKRWLGRTDGIGAGS